MSLIAEAFAQVRPDLTNFARELRAGLQTEIAKVKIPTINVRPVVGQVQLRELRQQLLNSPALQVRVTPTLAPGAAATLRRQLAELNLQANVAVGRVTAAGAAAEASAASASPRRVAAGTTTPVEEAAVAVNEKRIAQLVTIEQLELRIANAQKVAAAAAADIVATKQVQASLTRIESDATRQLERAQISGDADAQARLVLVQEQITQTNALLAARRELASSTATIAQLEQASIGTATELGVARKNLEATERALSQAQSAFASATLAGDAALIQQTEVATRDATALNNVAIAAERAAAAQAAQAPILRQIQLVQDKIATARSPSGGTDLERANRAAVSAAAAERAAISLQTQVTRSEFQASAAHIRTADALAEEAAALRLTNAELLRNVRATQVSAASSAQASRGAIATGATFLGLRGAVLASSLPFLLATVAVTAFAKAIGQASELQRSLQVFQATTGSTADQMKEIEETARALGQDLSLPATSAQDAATALTELAKAGLSVRDSIDAARGVLQLSAAANISAGDAAKIAATQLNAFGLSGDQAIRITDGLAGASIAAQGEISDFAQAFQQVAAQAKQSGLSFEQTTALLTQLARAGIRGSDAGTSLRVELLRLVPATKAAQDAFKRLGIDINDTQTIGQQLPKIIDQFSEALAKLSPQDQTRAIRDIFGQDAGRSAIITLTQGADAFQKLQGTVTQAGSAATLTKARAEGLSGAVDGLGSTTQGLATTIGDDLVPALTAITHNITGAVSAADDFVQAFGPVIGLLKSVADVTPGGGDELAKIGLLIGAGVLLQRQFAKIIASRKADSVASTESAAIQIEDSAAVTVAIERQAAAHAAVQLAYERDAIAAGASSAKQVGAITAVTAAESVRFSKLRGFLGSSVKGISIAGLIGGTAATVAGDQIGGTTGGIVSSAGQGALVGSFFGPFGAVAGTIGGAVVGALEAEKTQNEKDKASAVAKWNSLTFIEQQNFKVTQPKMYAAMQQFFDIEDKPNPFQGRFNFQTAGDLNDPLAGLANQIVPPSLAGNPLQTALGQRAGISQSLEAQLREARAQSEGDDEALLDALRDRLRATRTQIANLNAALFRGSSDPKIMADIAKKLTARFKEEKELSDQIAGIIAASLNDFDPALAAIDLKITQAAGTETLADDINAQHDKVLALQKKLEAAIGDNAGAEIIAGLRQDVASAANAEISSQRQANQQAKTAAAEAARLADEAKDVRESQLRRIAEAAGNEGKAEANLIAFLQLRVRQEKANTTAREQALDALQQERQTQQQALAASAQLTIDVQTAVIDTAAAAAQLTTSKVDDIAVENRRKAAFEIQLRHAQQVRDQAKKGTDEYKKAQLEVERLNQAILGVDLAIKNLRGGSGFTLTDFFKQTQQIVEEFSGNVGSIQSAFTGGEVAASVSRLAQKALVPAVANGKIVTGTAATRRTWIGAGGEADAFTKRLNEQQSTFYKKATSQADRTNELLLQIVENTSGGRTESVAVPPAGFATAVHTRRMATVTKVGS